MLLTPEQRSHFVERGRSATCDDLRAEVHTHAADVDVLSCLLAGVMERNDLADKRAATLALACAMAAHPAPVREADVCGTHQHLLRALADPACGDAALADTIKNYGMHEVVRANLFKGITDIQGNGRSAAQLRIALALIAAEDAPVKLEDSPSRQKAVESVGADADLTDMTTTMRTYAGTRDVVKYLWQGAELRAGSTVIAGMNRRLHVCSVAFAHAACNIPARTQDSMLKFLGHHGSPALLEQAARRFAMPAALDTLIDGAQARIRESFNAGMTQYTAVCDATLKSLPYDLKIERPYDLMAEHIAAHGSDAQIEMLIGKFYHDTRLPHIIDRAIDKIAGVDATQLRRKQVVVDIYAKGAPAAHLLQRQHMATTQKQVVRAMTVQVKPKA